MLALLCRILGAAQTAALGYKRLWAHTANESPNRPNDCLAQINDIISTQKERALERLVYFLAPGPGGRCTVESLAKPLLRNTDG